VRRITYAAAFIEGIYGVLQEDPNLSIVTVGGLLDHGPEKKYEAPLTRDFSDRLIVPPSSEGATTALGIGAALVGHRMFLHYGTSGFALEAWNQIVHEASLARYMSGGKVSVPLTLHGYHGVRIGGAPQHSLSPQSMLANIPGIEVVMPASPADVKGLIRSCLKSDNPTFIFNHTKLLPLEGDVPEEDYDIPFGVADVKKEGTDVTIVAMSFMVQLALQAATTLAKEGIDAEVIDPRTAIPLDYQSICASVRKTGRLVTVDEANQFCSIGSEICASVTERVFADLKAAPIRVSRLDCPAPFSPPLEKVVVPDVERIAAAVRKVVAAK
jgi:pyruvate dehydrogenase E1 component beta subunit